MTTTRDDLAKSEAILVAAIEVNVPELVVARTGHRRRGKPWSNGQTEGQITRLKLIKRQMYGRAKLDLVQARLIGAS
ncbi:MULTISPECIES: hypothetical protein [unclassified Mesorhizobium]|uniref:hypothetical protein n=1 Tax=unclassified Mesorhizobium TaxID=325217 RepID=UPI001FEE3E74|nr:MULTISPECIES: hypothetical protein [unclassified Mesorhizobium]